MPAFSGKSENELTLRRLARLRLVSVLAIEQLLFLPFLTLDVRAQQVQPNQIITDGRTATSVTTQGAVTSVTTSTVSGPNAFNSFSQFGVGQGNTVNLYTPNGAQNLINVVRDAPAYVNGTLNSYANGKIGGNVYFADPYGFVVGKSGTVNVGSLNVSTPSKGFTDSIIGANGAINGGAVANLMSGSFPISPDGNIRILGRINAEDGVRLTGQNVVIGGAGMNTRERVNADHAVKFAASVNSRGLRSASSISVSNGSIHIGAVNTASINGRLSARSRTNTPSTITVEAGKNITLGQTASLTTASKTGDAGNMTLKTQGDLTVKSGAKINASSAKGNGGVVDLSADGKFDIGDKVNINLAAPNGQHGKLILDPTDIIIGDASQGDANVNMSNATVAAAIAALNGTGTFSLVASNSITVDQHGRIDAGTGAVNVTLSAPTLTLLAGSYLRGNTVALDSGISGTVNVNAAANGGAQVIANTLNFTAGHLVLTSTATAFVGDATASPNKTAAGFISNAAIARYSAAMNGAGDLTVSAATSITVDASGVLDTRTISNGLSTAGSLDVTLKAPTITVMAGGQVLTKANNDSNSAFATGDITLDATSTLAGTVSVAGTLAGGVTTLQAGQSVTLTSTGIIDTRIRDSNGFATANSKNVVLTAQSITASQGSQILAGAVNADNTTTYVGGNVRFDATSISSGVVAANGAIVGDNVDLWAGSTVNVGAGATIASSVPSGTAAITLQAPNITVATGAAFSAPGVNGGDPVRGATVNYNLQSAFAANNSASNAVVQQYIAALNGSGKMTLSSTSSLVIDTQGVVNAGNLDLTLSAPTLILSAGSSVSAHAVILASDNTLSIDASRNGGAQITSATPLQLAAATLQLTNTAAAVVVGDEALDAGVNLTNSTIAKYLAAGPVQSLRITGGTSITVDAAGVIDTRHNTAGLTSATPANIILAAPTLTIAAGATVRADVVNIPVQDPSITTAQVPPPTFYKAGDITLTSADITVGAGTLNGGVVTFNDGQSRINVGVTDPGGTTFLSNTKIASYLAALGGSSTFGLAASVSISIDSGAVIAGGATRNLSFTAPTLTFATNSSISGNTITANAGLTGVINVNAASTGGAQITAQTPLQLTASQVNLTSTSAMFVGDATASANKNAGGFISNATVARYVTALQGTGTLQLQASGSITVDATGIVDGTRMSSNVSTGNSVNLLLTAPSITVAALGKVTALAVNSGGTTYTSGSVTLNAAGSGSGLVNVAGTVKGGTVLLNSNFITVAGGATLSAGPTGTVIFAFDEDLTVNSTTGNNGTGGVLSNNIVATYIAAMSAGTFALSAGSHNLTLASNASITAGSGIAVGLSGATLNVVTGAAINAVTAVGFGFNQDDIVIAASNPGGGGTFVSNSTIAALVLASANATTLTISANKSITVASTGIIDTRFFNAQQHSTHNALGIELDAPTITVANGAQILAKASSGSGFTDGDVTLSAVSSTSLISGLARSTTSITVDGMITGGNITIAANSSASSNMTGGAAGYLAVIAELLAGVGFNAGYVAGESNATVAINSHANISGSGNIGITATGSETAADPVIVPGAISPVGASAVVGSVKANISVIVAPCSAVNTCATIAAGGSLRIAAANDATLDVSALTITTSAQFVATAAVGLADINTQAIVNSGANISSGAGGISVIARNGNYFSTSATAFAFSPTTGSGGVGAVVAYSQVSSTATAILGANVGSSGAASAGPVTVSAVSDTSKNAVSASVTLGQPALFTSIIGAVAGLGKGAGALIGALMGPLVSIEFPLKVAGSLSLANSSQSANAAIAATGGGAAPAIYSAGDVSVVSRLIDDQIRDNSASSVTVSNPSKPEAATIAAAVAYGSYTHNSNAYIGQGVFINASRIAVSADTSLPNTNTWGQWNGLSETLSHVNANLGAVNNVITTYADATSSGGAELSVSGSFAYFGNTDNTTAWIGSGATLQSTKTTPGAWSAVVEDGSQHGLTVNFASNITVSATATNNSINIGGVFGPAVLMPGADSGGAAAGGSLNLIISTSNTNAGVSNGVTLSAKDVAVTAITTDLMFAIAPTSGSSSGSISLNGLTSLGFINNETHASISSGATVTAATININAYQNISVLSLAGAIQLSTTSGVGISVAYLMVNTDTSAYIGDNHSDIRIAGDDAGAASADGGVFTSSALTVLASTAAHLTVASIAVVESDPFAQLGAVTKAKSILAGATGVFGTSPTSILDRAAAAAAQKSGSPTLSIDIAGSSAVSQTGIDTSAYINGVTINPSNPYAAATTPFVTVQAQNYTVLDNGSGAGALNFAGGTNPSAAVSGTIAIAMSENSTKAFIANTTISDEANVSVSALTGGQETVVAIGMSVTRKGIAASIAASVAMIADSTMAYIDHSTITGVANGTANTLAVTAYQTSNIAIGGGSLYLSGGSGSAGLALTYANIRDPGGGKAVDAHITNTQINAFNTLTVLGDDAAVIAAGAASGGLGGNGLAGAVVISEISPSIVAYLSGDTITMSAGGTITVLAESLDQSSLDTILTSTVRANNNGQIAVSTCGPSGSPTACTDFSGAALDDNGTGSAPGAAITSVAGLVQAGKNNAGVALVFDDISTSHTAYVLQSTITAGDVSVAAEDSAKIQSVTVGVGAATGKFAGTAGITLSTIKNNVSASIGDSTSTNANLSINARNVTVQATDGSSIISHAIIAGLGTQASAVGLAIVYSEIDNQINAALTGARIVASGNVVVNAASVGAINTAAVGVAIAGGNFSLAGSVATNVLGTNVSASIAGGADVTATDNVGVIASNTDTVGVFAGALSLTKGSAGGAGSLVTNKITGSTTASISGAGTQVDALGTSSSDTLLVNGGTLIHTFDIGGFNSPTDNTPDLSENQQAVRGLAVVASSHQAIVANVASVAASQGVTIMANVITNVMGGTTKAYIDSASIDTRLTSTTLAPQIVVAGSSFSYAGTFGLGIVAPSGTAGGGATIISTTMSRETYATITNSTVGGLVGSSPTVGDVTVKANAEQDASSIAVGFNSGSVGLNVFIATTEAYVDGGALTAASLSVLAKDSTGIASANGSGAYGSSAAIGAAFLVQVSANKTEAYVGDEFHYQGTGAAHHTTVTLTGALDIEATTIDRFQAFSVGGALGGSVGVAGMANIEIANNTTIAGIYDTTVASPTGAVSSVTVNATEDVAIKEIAGALAIGTSGGVGFGAAANVLVFKSKTVAEVWDSDLTASGAVNVNALSTKEVLSYAVTAGIGTSTGIGAAVGVIIIGTNTTDPDTQNQEGQLNGTVAAVNTQTSTDQGAGVVGGGQPGNPNNAGATSTYNVSGVLNGGNDAVTAQISYTSTIHTVTAGSVTVAATSANANKMFLLGAGFGKDAGVGAAIGYTNVSSSVLASLNATVHSSSVGVFATVQDASTGPYSGKTVDTESTAGGLALYFGADASVAVGNVTNTVTAEVGGAVTGTGGTGVMVSALDTSTQSVQAGGGSGGIAAVGASIATTGKSSTVQAGLIENTTVNAATLAVIAAEAGALSAESVAVGGGVVAGQASVATANETSTVTAVIGAGSSVTTTATGLGTLVSASSTPDVSASSLGVVVGGGALGISIAMSKASVTVTADAGDNSTFVGGPVAIAAMQVAPNTGYNVQATAYAGAGGALLGAQGSYAEADNKSTVKAYGGTGIHLPDGDVIIGAENDSKQLAKALGVSLSGFVGVGATVAKATSDADTEAYLKAGAVTNASREGILQIDATGTDTNTANAVAGAGGTIAGAAAVGITDAKATTYATLFGNTSTDTIYTGGLNVKATHTTNFSGTGDAFTASFAGAAGGVATNGVTSTTTAEIGTNLIVNSAGGDMIVISNDIVKQTGGQARAGSGGVISGSAAVSTTTVTQHVATNIDSGTILSLNDNPDGSTAKLNIEAFNTVNTADTVNMIVGGVFAGGDSQSKTTANADLTVNINATELFSAGALYVGSASSMASSNNANANLYGIITGAGANSESNLSATQAVNVSANSTIEAWGALGIFAGQSGDGGTFSNIAAGATTVVYNYALVPATGQFRGSANANDDATLTLAGGSQILGVTNVSLGATRGFVSAAGNGTAYNPYLSAFSTANYDNHSHNTGSATAFLNGTIAAGIYKDETITIAYGSMTPLLTNTSTLATATSPYAIALEWVPDPNHFNPTVSYNHQKIQYTVVNGFNPYQEIVQQLSTLSGLSTADVSTQLSQRNPTITVAAASDPTGDVQRQINTLIKQAPFAANAAGAAIDFGNIMVSAGNVTILAEVASGTQAAGKPAPTISAGGTVALTIDNQGLNFLALSKLTATNIIGGHVTWTGAANDTNTPGVTIHQDLSNPTPAITIRSSYSYNDPATGQPADQLNNPLSHTPDIYFTGVVSNVNGLFNINNALGNVVASQSFNAATIQLIAPHGTFTFNGGAGSIFSTNNDVASQWQGTEYRPTDTLTAVYAAATYLGSYGANGPGGVYLGGDGSKSPYSYYWDSHAGAVSSSVAGTSNPNVIFTARMLDLAYDGHTLYSAIFLPTGYTNNNDSLGGSGITANNPTALAQAEGTTAGNITVAGWQRNNYRGEAYDGDSGPFHCNGCGNYFQAIQIQSQVITPKTEPTPLTHTDPGSLNAAKALLLSASVLNINGIIQSGQSSNYSVNLDGNLRTTINSLLSNSLTNVSLSSVTAQAQQGKYFDLTPYLTANSSDVLIGARFNVLTNQILLNSVVQGTGGYVYLNGKIISTSTDGTQQGQIVVNGGAGTVTVNNTTGFGLVTNIINTGVSAASVIQIVDQLKQQTTWYVYNAGAPAGQQVATYQVNNVNTSNYSDTMLQGIGGTGGIVYNPAANQYLQWTESATLTRSTGGNPAAYGWTWNNPNSPWSDPVYSLVANVKSVSNGVASNTNQSTNFQEVVTATGHATSYNVATNTSSSGCCGTDFSNSGSTWVQEIYDSLTLTLTNTVKASYGIGIQFNGGGTSSVNVTSDASIVINGSINNLQGNTVVRATNANASITVGATANNPLISGTNVTLAAPGGIGSLAGGTKRPVPVQVYGGTLTALSGGGDIAIAAQGALRINNVSTNDLNAHGSLGNVYLSATGDINSSGNYNTSAPVVTGNNVEINSTGGAIGATTTLDAQNNTVLTNINPLVIQATGTVLADGSVDGGVVNSASSTGTYLVQSTKDLRLGAISSNGVVFLAAAGADGNAANIVNGLSSGGLTATQAAHLRNVWNDLSLASGSATVAVNNYQAMVNAAYTDYWQLRNLAFSNDSLSSYNPTSLGLTVLTAQVVAKYNITNISSIDPTVFQAMLKTEATQRFEAAQYLLGIKTAAQLADSLTTLFGANLGGNAYLQAAPTTAALTTALGAFDKNFSYVLSNTTTLYSQITSGSQWTQDQLTYTVSPGANPANGVLPPAVSDVNVLTNVSGRQVMLYAPNGSIGKLAAPQTFSFTSVDSSNLDATQKALLTSAGPGQLHVDAQTDATTGVVTYTVSVTLDNLVVLNPLTSVAAKAQGDVYLGSKSNLAFGGITNDKFGPITDAIVSTDPTVVGVRTTGSGNVKLDAVGNIVASVAGQTAISGDIRLLTLISETGSIGVAPTAGSNPAVNLGALQVNFTNPSVTRLDQASAVQGIYLKQNSGDLVLGNITSSGAIQFAATGSIYQESQFTDPTSVHIAGASLDLRAGGNIGFNGSTAQPLQVKIAGAVTGSAVGNITILSPEIDLNVGTSGAYGALTAGGTLTLNANVTAALLAFTKLNINGDISSDGTMLLLAKGAVTFGAGTSTDLVSAASLHGAVTLSGASLAMGAYTEIDAGGVITIATVGDATLGQLNSSASYAAAGNAASIVVSAGGVSIGSILGNGDGRTNLIASGTDAHIALSANSIGTSSQRVTFNAPFLSATASTGDIYLSALASVEASLLSAVKGNVDLRGSGNLTLDSVLAGTDTGATGTFKAVTTAGSITIGTAASSGSQTVHATQNVTFKALSASGVTGDDVGDISVIADNGFILAQTVTNGGVTTQGSVAANGSATLSAGTTISGNTLAAATGAGSLTANGLITWNTLNVGTTLGATSNQDSILFQTATSGGTQNLQAHNNVTFNALAATGAGSDIVVNATTGFILAQTVTAGSVTTQGSVAAGHTASLTAGTTITGNTLTATTGSGSLTANGLISWNTLNVATTLGATSNQDSILFQTATSGGTQNLQAHNNVTFNALAATGAGSDITVNATTGFILAQTVTAGGVTTQGSVAAGHTASLTAGTTITGNTLTATTGSGSLTANGLISWNTLNVATTLGATSNQDSILFQTATSGGTQNLQAHNNVTFNALAATGAGSDIAVNATTGFILAQTVTTGGVTTQGSVAAGHTASLTAGTTISGNTLTATTGSGSLVANGLINWNTLNVATTLGATSNQDSILFQTATSGGTQNLQAHNNITFNALAAAGAGSDIAVNATNGFILAQTVTIGGVTTQGSVAAGHTASLTAGTTITGNTLTATTGDGSLFAPGLITWNTLDVANALGVTSTGSSIALVSAHSGGSQTLQAQQNVTFTQLTTDGTGSDAGDVGINAATGALSGGSINAHGSASLVAATSNTGHNLTTVTGAATLQGQLVKWDNLTIAGSLGITATAGKITLGTATSGGSQNLHATDDIVFSQLTASGIAGDPGDVTLRSDNGSILGGSVFANNDVHFYTGKSLSLDALRGNHIALSAPDDITIRDVSVVSQLDLAANTINVSGRQIMSNPSIPLVMNVTGYNGGIATSAHITIDPSAIVINQYRVVDSTFVTDAPQVKIVNGLVTGQLMLTTLNQQILLDNRSPAPSNWGTLQLYQPGGAFTLIQAFNANFTDAYVVQFTGDISSTVSTYSDSHTCCNTYTGSMAIRNIANDTAGQDDDNFWMTQKGDAETFRRLGIAGDARLRALQSPKSVEVIGNGPAVNIEGLTEARKLRQLLRQGQKSGKPGWRSTELNDNASRSVERFASAQ